MSANLIYPLYETFKDDELALFYLGKFSDKSLLALTDIVHSLDQKSKNFGKLRSKAIYLMIEAFQNIIRYSLNTYSNNFFMTRKIKNNIYISTANVVSDQKVIDLKQRIDDLNNMNREALREKYRSILENKQFSEAGGAGLGLVEISRKTKQKIDYHFENYFQKDNIFYILIKYLQDEVENKTDVYITKDLYSFLDLNNIILFFKHEFDETINEAVIRACDLNFISNNNRQKKLAFHLSIEVLQNMSLHAYKNKDKTEGVFFIAKQNDNYIVNAGNLIANDNLKDFIKFLKIIKNSTKKELDLMYREQLLEENFDGNGGLGFIDIAREAIEFNYRFFKINQNFSFFAFTFKI